jgi:hypothetical protein
MGGVRGVLIIAFGVTWIVALWGHSAVQILNPTASSVVQSFQ